VECHHIAIVSEFAGIDCAGLARVTAAIQKQVVQDFAPIWGVMATVDSFPRLEDVPTGYWTIRITAEDLGGELGLHYDEVGQPHATITYSDSWSVSASHECLEMLIDPWGNKLQSGRSLIDPNARVQYLVEVCDPCQHANYAYPVNDTLVSEFYTPAYFDPQPRSGVRYSLTGALKEPLSILPGGYLSWNDPQDGVWWRSDGGEHPEKLGRLNPADGSMRQQINAMTSDHLLSTHLSHDEVLERVGKRRELAKAAAVRRASTLRDLTKAEMADRVPSPPISDQQPKGTE